MLAPMTQNSTMNVDCSLYKLRKAALFIRRAEILSLSASLTSQRATEYGSVTEEEKLLGKGKKVYK